MWSSSSSSSLYLYRSADEVSRDQSTLARAHVRKWWCSLLRNLDMAAARPHNVRMGTAQPKRSSTAGSQLFTYNMICDLVCLLAVVTVAVYMLKYLVFG